MEYRVQLDVYNGPLDLLLYLIKRDELDIYDIPISRILDSYIPTCEMLQGLQGGPRGLDINVAGEFLVDGGDADGDQVGDAPAASAART